jgi:hypothetical protein
MQSKQLTFNAYKSTYGQFILLSEFFKTAPIFYFLFFSLFIISLLFIVLFFFSFHRNSNYEDLSTRKI